MSKKQTFTQLLGYLVAGSCATAVHFIILTVLVEKLSVRPVPASMLGFLAGATTGFLINRNFVFKAQYAKRLAFLKYCLMAGVSGLLNGLLLTFLIYNLMLHYLLAQLLATTSIFLLNFICCKLWIFNRVTHAD